MPIELGSANDHASHNVLSALLARKLGDLTLLVFGVLSAKFWKFLPTKLLNVRSMQFPRSIIGYRRVYKLGYGRLGLQLWYPYTIMFKVITLKLHSLFYLGFATAGLPSTEEKEYTASDEDGRAANHSSYDDMFLACSKS